MKFTLLFAIAIASTSAVRLTNKPKAEPTKTDPATYKAVGPAWRNNTTKEAAANHQNQVIAHAIADDQAEHVRHHYGARTPSGTNYQTWGNESTGGFYGSNRTAGIQNGSSMNPHGQEVVHTSNIIRNGHTNVVNGDNLRS